MNKKVNINKAIKAVEFPEVAFLEKRSYPYKSCDGIIIKLNDGSKIVFTHEQECCETVSIKDISGSLTEEDSFDGLVLNSITLKEIKYEKTEFGDETMFLYELQFDKGFMQLTFVGETNSYYSTDVDVFIMKDGQEKRLF